MRCLVRRSSLAGSDEKPCDEAVQFDGEWFVDFETLDDLETFCLAYGSVLIQPDPPARRSAAAVWYLEIYDLFNCGGV